MSNWPNTFCGLRSVHYFDLGEKSNKRPTQKSEWSHGRLNLFDPRRRDDTFIFNNHRFEAVDSWRCRSRAPPNATLKCNQTKINCYFPRIHYTREQFPLQNLSTLKNSGLRAGKSTPCRCLYKIVEFNARHRRYSHADSCKWKEQCK